MKNIMKAVALGLLFSIGGQTSVQACLNTYAFELGRGLEKSQIQQQLKASAKIKNKSIQQLNDYGVLLIYDGQYKQAIELFLAIEKQQPSLAKTAANLGTAYELNGQPTRAKYWISQGMQRDPNIHKGSEWIHLKILDAQLLQKANPKWIETNDVLGLDFGTAAAPVAHTKTVSFQEQKFDLDRVLADSKVQMDQRLPFVKQDPITAQIVFNMANIEVLQYNTEDDTAGMLYRISGDLGFRNPELIHARQNYIKTSKWYHFKSWIAYFVTQVKKLF